MAEVVIEIRPETPISSVWRVYEKGGNQMLRENGRVLGGTFKQAHAAALHLARTEGFAYTPPAW